ncbi:MAG: tyrosine-type recombinase/integrase [Burkholderiales bacterium]|nr:tyrosine-type recombinase/integrase [Burkholderiales bacterium]
MKPYNHSLIRQVAKELDSTIATNLGIRATNDIEAIKTWLAEFKSSPNTFTSYKQCAERFIMWSMQHSLTLESLKREDIEDYQLFLAAPTPHELWCGPAVGRKNPSWKPFVRGLSNSSIKLNLQILATMYEYLVQSGYLAINPFHLIKRKAARLTLNNNNNIQRYLTHKEWNLIIEYLENMPKIDSVQQRNYHRIKWIFNLLYYSGCRRSEVINAKMADFMYKRDQWWLKVIGKGNKYGEIPVPNALLLALVDYRKSLGLSDYPNSLETNIALINNIHFKSRKLVAISDSMLYKIIKNTCRNIANEVKLIDSGAAYVIEKVSTHWLRHTSATHQVDAGIDIRVVKENLRHSMLETTMRYQHTEDDVRHRETTEKFGVK